MWDDLTSPWSYKFGSTTGCHTDITIYGRSARLLFGSLKIYLVCLQHKIENIDLIRPHIRTSYLCNSCVIHRNMERENNPKLIFFRTWKVWADYEVVGGMRSRGKTHPVVETPTISNVQQQYGVSQTQMDRLNGFRWNVHQQYAGSRNKMDRSMDQSVDRWNGFRPVDWFRLVYGLNMRSFALMTGLKWTWMFVWSNLLIQTGCPSNLGAQISKIYNS